MLVLSAVAVSLLVLAGSWKRAGEDLLLIPPPEGRLHGPSTAEDPRRVTVHAGGPGILRPGRYVLPSNGTVADLIRAAGGLRPGARRSVVPWRRPLREDLRLHVPLRGEGYVRGRWSTAPEVWYDTRPVNVNRAGTKALQVLPGVGPVLAGRIVQSRRRRGPFGSVRALKRVRGIGPATLKRLRRRITVYRPTRFDTPGSSP